MTPNDSTTAGGRDEQPVIHITDKMLQDPAFTEAIHDAIHGHHNARPDTPASESPTPEDWQRVQAGVRDATRKVQDASEPGQEAGEWRSERIDNWRARVSRPGKMLSFEVPDCDGPVLRDRLNAYEAEIARLKEEVVDADRAMEEWKFTAIATGERENRLKAESPDRTLLAEAVMALQELDVHLDFSEEVREGPDGIGFEDATGINAAFRKAHDLLARLDAAQTEAGRE